jgi:IS605 OrfB family transposase
MLSLKLPIIHNSDANFVEDKMKQHGYAFREVLKRLDESSNQGFEDEIKNKFNLTDIEYRSVKCNAETFFKQCETNRKKLLKRIETKQEELDELLKKRNDKKELTKKEKYSVHKLQTLLPRLKSSLNNKPVFGGRKNLQHLTHLHNQYNKLLINLSSSVDETDILNLEQELIELFDRITKQKEKYVNQRLRSFFIIGEKNYRGNRFFDFSKLNEGLLVYTPNRRTKVNLTVSVPKNKKWSINKLVELSQTKSIPLSVYVSNKTVSISYDDEKLYGWKLDETEKKQQIKEIKQKYNDKEIQTTLIKSVCHKHHIKERKVKLANKIEGRCVSIDMNPSYLGVSILERDFDNEDIERGKHAVKVIHKFCYDLSFFTKKLPKEATKEERFYHKNKQQYEIKEMTIQLFNIANHYKCSSFVMEDLDFKEDKEVNKKSKEANRQTKVVWNRGLLEQMITKLTNQFGIELIKVQPSYSSFIGNIMYNYFDPINSAIEIGRRGLYMFIKNCTGYPLISESTLNTVVRVLEENKKDVSNVNISNMTWFSLFNLGKKCRWRGSLSRVTKRRSMSTKRSCIKVLYC